VKVKKTMRLPEPDRLRGLAIIFVVAIHTFGYLKTPPDAVWSTVWFLVHQTGVPSFFLADGWLFAKRNRQPMSRGPQIEYLSNSARRLLLPWLVFSILYLALRLASQGVGAAGGETVIVNSPAALAIAIWHGAAAEGLYFLPALMIVRVVTTPLHRLVAGSPPRALALALLLLVGWRVLLEPHLPVPAVGVDPLLAAMMGLCFAAVGWVLAEASARRALPVTLVSIAALAVCAAVLDGRASAMCAQTSAVLALWAIAVAIPARVAGSFEWLGRRTMEIYLLHAPYIIKLACVAVTPLPIVIGFPAAVATATAGALAVAFVLARLGLDWMWSATPRMSGRVSWRRLFERRRRNVGTFVS
jgi:fucose 4-O-acetylase-like acetyltransferase